MGIEGKWVEWNIFGKGATFAGKTDKDNEPRYILRMSADSRSKIDRDIRIEDVTQEEYDETEVGSSYDYWMTSKDGKKWDFYYG